MNFTKKMSRKFIENMNKSNNNKPDVRELALERGMAFPFDEDLVAKALDIIDKTGAKYTMLIPSTEIEAWVMDSIRFYPTTIFVDENGEHIKFVEGANSKEGWIEIIEEVLANEE